MNLSDPELEMSVLAAVLLAPKAALPILVAEEHVVEETFNSLFHRAVWRAILLLSERGDSIDTLTVSRVLLDTGTPDDGQLDILATHTAGVAGVRTYARRLIALARWREVRLAGQELTAAAEAMNKEMLEAAEARLTVRDGTESQSLSADGVRELLWNHLQDDTAEDDGGAPIVFPRLRGVLGSLRWAETTIVAGWSSHGKSIIIDALLAHAAENGATGHLYVNEGSVKTRALRILSALSGVPLRRLERPRDLAPDMQTRAVKALESIPFGITPIYDWTAADVARDMRFRRWQVVGIDLLHLIPWTKESELAENMGRLTSTARAVGSHLLLGAHLNEERAKQAKLPVPVLRDIRGSGMIKNDADNVLFIHRIQETDAQGVTTPTAEALLLVAKGRNGELGGTRVVLNGATVSYREMAHDEASSVSPAAEPTPTAMPF